MYVLYSLILSLAFVALLPYFFYQALRHGKYAVSFKQRLGSLPESVRHDGRETIWVHAVSVGEFIAARPLIERIRQELPDYRVVVSTTTLTGQTLARSQEGTLFDAALYFPFDWVFSVRQALGHVKPALVVILETELWPNFLRECRRRGVATVVANGRISPRSFRRYKRARGFIAKVLGDIRLLIMQSEGDAERARSLGARAGRVLMCGNLKYDVGGDAGTRGRGDAAIAEDIDARFSLSSSEHLIVAGSTAQGEEEMLLDALREVRKRPGLEGVRLLIAPRHPERFDEVANLFARSGFGYARRSEARKATAEISSAAQVREGAPGVISDAGKAGHERPVDVILLDSIGELRAVYSFAAVVFVGGSMVRRGGHNVIEPAAYARPVVVGPHTENFRQIVADFRQEEALVQVNFSEGQESAALARELTRLLSDRESARAMGERAHRLLAKNQGATECTLKAILTLMRDA